MPTKEAKVLMIQGTTSNAGKTTLVAGLCRALHQEGMNVAPFKGWNMSLNSRITPDGHEIGAGQYIQAEAAQVMPIKEMNPVLVKPQTEGPWQRIVHGRVVTPEEMAAINQQPEGISKVIRESLEFMRARHDVVIIEGSGSPAEPGLMQYDVANMRVAKAANAPVLMVANIDPQGAYASLIGTMEILKDKDPDGARLIEGFIINKFSGRPEDLREANEYLFRKTGIPVIGVLPLIEKLAIDDEDSTGLRDRQMRKAGAVLDVVVPMLQTLQNTDDFKALSMEEGVNVRLVDREEDFGNPDLVLIGGSKGTIADLKWLEKTGLAQHIKRHAESGRAVIGICGGYQILGQTISDPLQVESGQGEVPGLGLLPARTVFEQGKVTRQVSARMGDGVGLLANTVGLTIEGYEIHMGRTQVDGKPLLHLSHTAEEAVTADGALAQEGWIIGTYLHGLLKNTELRRTLLRNLAQKKGVTLPEPQSTGVDEYDRLADFMKVNLNMAFINRLLEKQ